MCHQKGLHPPAAWAIGGNVGEFNGSRILETENPGTVIAVMPSESAILADNQNAGS
jgi:hypothetical protein